MSRRDYGAIYAAKDGIYAISLFPGHLRLWERARPANASAQTTCPGLMHSRGKPAPTEVAA